MGKHFWGSEQICLLKRAAILPGIPCFFVKPKLTLDVFRHNDICRSYCYMYDWIVICVLNSQLQHFM